MFSQQWSESSRKRVREDEEIELDMAMGGTQGFTEHRNKRLHSLPVRTSPPTHRRCMAPLSFPATTITRTDSDSEDMLHQRRPNLPMDFDMDMMVDNYPSPRHLHPGSSQPDVTTPSSAGRMPTPIHCTFAAQVRGSNWGPVNQGVQHAANVVIPEHEASFAQPRSVPQRQDPSIPRSLDGGAEWSMVHNRRLPSPISENGGEDVPTSPSMILDSCAPVQIQRPYLPHMPHSTNPHAMAIHPNIQSPPQPAESDAAMMDTDGASPLSAPATPSPRGKFGHSRSKHTLNSWTIQPGMKKSFSIGYRADCEKCRMKIPGHFNHIIIS
ncbi:hypothetical protein F4809DRAFT_301975 [Biscogniauxia mediterranea]|nr:hypothetical protein F4809DRAFT_301975 [Biscogniauxia mediterranea]